MKALLALENGFTLEGTSFTGEFETGGEVIFNTGMGGYQELPWQLGNGALQPGESTSGYTSYTFTLQDALRDR